jgi:ribose transport system permease protein
MTTLTMDRPRAAVSLARLTRSGLAAWIVVLVMVVALTASDPVAFWSAPNIANILTSTVVLGLVALGQHVVILTGGIDLSVGSSATLASLLTAVLVDGYPIRTVPVIALVLVIGALTGCCHGLLVSRLNLPPFIVTLASLYLIQGVALLVSTTPTGQVTAAMADFALGRVGPVPVMFVVLVAATVAVSHLLYRTVVGRHIFAVGGSIEAARSSGVPVRRAVVVAYVVSATFAALAGILLASRATLGSPTAGNGLELSAITVVVIGGTSLLGGSGRLIGTLGGVALLALVTSAVTFLQLPATLTDLIRGIVIIAAAAVFVTKDKQR